ncbi:oligosaccharide flippase family protein [Ramlibacter algicola]|uniref:Oligosaccharide flippase family protein n=1 Tax=Ramlibacter algicola TaxID=2795217 RepID=A0A934Q0B1_9BURK|nr:oligosaccharide flippase family protein [Ramlibacter algicola]MBK0391947.1 oligosaccharide flippase family protein [Ramlibacter algicola]
MFRNISSNVFGTVLPSLAALVAVPLLIDKLGVAGFGTFSLQVAALFFFGLADLGIARAIVLLSFEPEFAKRGAWRRPYKVGVRYSAWIALGIALVGIPVAGVLAEWPPAAQASPADLAWSTLLVFFSAGLTLLMQAPRAVLESQERFLQVNVIRGPAAAAIFLGPLLALQVHNSLTAAAVSLLLTRAIALLLFLVMCGHFTDADLRAPMGREERARLGPLFVRTAGWIGATNLLSMLLAYLDRFVLGALGSATMVGQYAVAQEVVTKAWISAGAVISAATPRLASAAADAPETARRVVRQIAIWMLAGGVLPSLILIAFGEPLLRLWLRGSFDPAFVLPMQVMAVGLGVNTLSQVNFTLLQVSGGVREGAYLQAINLVTLSAGLLLAVPAFGTLGAAGVFSVRLLLDAAVVRWLLRRRLADRRQGIGVPAMLALAVASCLLLWAVRDMGLSS